MESWADQHVLVTGAGGFVGSHLVHALLKRGARVTAWIRGGSGIPGWRLAVLKVGGFKGLQVDRVDIGDAVSVQGALSRTMSGPVGPPTLVYHLAAQAHVGECWQRPSEAVRTNIEGTVHLLQALATVPVASRPHRVVIAGSSEEYGYAAKGGNDVRAELAPRSLYATTKVAQEQIGRMFWRAFDLPVIVARPHNIYGPMQGSRYVTPTVIMQALAGPVKLGSPYPRRDFTFVEDAVDAYMRLGRHGEPGAIYGWGAGASWTIGEWARMAVEAVVGLGYARPELEWAESTPDRPGASEVMDLVANNDALVAMGWAPQMVPEKGLKWTAAWFDNHPMAAGPAR